MFKNPFSFKELSLEAPFCDREKELSELRAYAEGGANVVVFSPRRYGKTSLVKRVQHELSKHGYTTILVDFFGVSSVEDVASRLAKTVFAATRARESLFRKAIRTLKSFRPVLKPDESGGISLTIELVSRQTGGTDLLEEALSSLGELANDEKFHVALDEFQEIIELKESRRIEGVMRSHIQSHPFSYFFIGSRRRILLDMFNEKKRPFFQSAINYELKKLLHVDLTDFIVSMFSGAGKSCPEPAAGMISNTVLQHPYYAQKLSFFVYELAEETVQKKDVTAAVKSLTSSEKPVFEAMLQGLAPKQISLLRAIAEEPSASIFSMDYMKRHNLSSMGGAQGAIKRLALLDIIEKNEKGMWDIVDPIFKHWLSSQDYLT